MAKEFRPRDRQPSRSDPQISPAILPEDFTLLQVTPALDAGGVETLTVDMASAAAAAGARSLVASHGGRLESDLARGGSELIRLPVRSRNPVTMAANAVRLESVIRRERVSLVHVRSRAPAFSALYAARRTRTPVITTYHGIYAARSSLKRWYNSVMTRGDAVIANSAYTRDHILGEHHTAPARIVVIPEGIDTVAFDPAAVSPDRIARVREAWGTDLDDGRQVILVAARLARWKGHGVIIRALATGGAARARLVFAGAGENGAYASELAADARSRGVELILAGPCADMPAAYLAADFVAAPSTDPESFGRSVAEGGAMRRVVIASRLGGAAETVIDAATGWLVAPGDVAAWTKALDLALAMAPEERTSMGAAARARICDAYSLERMCEATFDLYRRMSGARS